MHVMLVHFDLTAFLPGRQHFSSIFQRRALNPRGVTQDYSTSKLAHWDEHQEAWFPRVLPPISGSQSLQQPGVLAKTIVTVPTLDKIQ